MSGRELVNMPRGIYIRTPEYRQKQREAMFRHENPGKNKSEETKIKIGNAQRRKPKSDEFREKCRERMKGIPFRLGIKLSPEERLNKSQTNCKGDKHWNWRGGLVKENQKERQSIEYRIWRQAVFERDNFICTECGKKDSGHLNADHIQAFAFFPELRFNVNNGRTLCKRCHENTETYFNKIRWKRTA